jgi:hypothetical protein
MRLLTRQRRVALLAAATLSLTVSGLVSASWSGTAGTLNPHANILQIQSHVRYQASAGTIKLTIDNGASNGFSMWLFNTANMSQSATLNLTYGNQGTGSKYFKTVAGSTTIPRMYWVPAVQIARDCLSGCDLTYGGWFDYQGSDNPG